MPPSISGKGWGGEVARAGGGDLNEEGGGEDCFDFLAGCDGAEVERVGI